MKRVGVREFKDKATSFIAKEESLVIEKHGNPVGFYIPVRAKDKRTRKDSGKGLNELMAEVLMMTGLSEDEFVSEVMKDWEGKGAKGKAKVNAARR
jgi:hypothetical protein